MAAGLYIFTCVLVCTTGVSAAVVPKNDGSTELLALDTSFQKFSSRFYTTYIAHNKLSKIDSIHLLAETSEAYRSQKQPVLATATILRNIDVVEKNIDTTPIIGVLSLLLETNEWNTASQLHRRIQKQGDKTLVSNISFSLAKHRFSRNQWKDTISIVESIRSDLPPEDYHHAQLMHGISLQHLQKHRAALGEYAKITATSAYYTTARLNMAVANIRQDSWTDAHIIINELLTDKGRNRDSALTDRLYTVMGYSLLQQHYFRNSRDAFRKISLNGKYTNKALLGLALTAAHQEDYVGALNAIKHLKQKKTRDLPVDEANLLLPYFYERLKQLTTASTAYLEAINYYEHRLLNIKNALPSDSDDLRKQVVTSNDGTVTINNEILELDEKLPRFIFNNIQMLAQFQPYIEQVGDNGLRREYATLNAEYRRILQKSAQDLLDEKASHLTHYMNQSRYGLARMQDHDATTTP